MCCGKQKWSLATLLPGAFSFFFCCLSFCCFIPDCHLGTRTFSALQANPVIDLVNRLMIAHWCALCIGDKDYKGLSGPDSHACMQWNIKTWPSDKSHLMFWPKLRIGFINTKRHANECITVVQLHSCNYPLGQEPGSARHPNPKNAVCQKIMEVQVWSRKAGPYAAPDSQLGVRGPPSRLLNSAVNYLSYSKDISLPCTTDLKISKFCLQPREIFLLSVVAI